MKLNPFGSKVIFARHWTKVILKQVNRTGNLLFWSRLIEIEAEKSPRVTIMNYTDSKEKTFA